MDDQSVSSTAVDSEAKSAKKSAVWEHYRVEKNDDKSRAFCIYCEKSYAANQGTTNLWAHVNYRCKEYPYSLKRKKTCEDGVQKDKYEDHFSEEEARKRLAQMIITDELPFRTVEGEGFIRYSEYLEPRFIVPSRVTVARDVLKLYEDEKVKLKGVFRSHRICLTTDTWTSIQNLNYMCLTGHWIDREWKLHKRILNFCLVSNHKGETIGKMVESCLLNWGIDNIFTLTVDNASSNDGAIRYLKRETLHWKGTILNHEFIHVRCCAHILNLVVKEGLEDVHDSILRIRNAIRYVRSSPSRLQSFKTCVEKLKIEHKGLVCLDVETRWNSTYESMSCQMFLSSQTSDELSDDDVEGDPVLSFQQKYSRHRKEIQNLESNSEVSRYLLESCEEIDEHFDVLKWWKSNASKYPTLSQVAKDVLAIPVSTVASESAFSTGGRILDPFRSSLSALMVEALVCCQNWLRSTPIPIDLREAMDTVEMYA